MEALRWSHPVSVPPERTSAATGAPRPAGPGGGSPGRGPGAGGGRRETGPGPGAGFGGRPPIRVGPRGCGPGPATPGRRGRARRTQAAAPARARPQRTTGAETDGAAPARTPAPFPQQEQPQTRRRRPFHGSARSLPAVSRLATRVSPVSGVRCQRTVDSWAPSPRPSPPGGGRGGAAPPVGRGGEPSWRSVGALPVRFDLIVPRRITTRRRSSPRSATNPTAPGPTGSCLRVVGPPHRWIRSHCPCSRTSSSIRSGRRCK